MSIVKKKQKKTQKNRLKKTEVLEFRARSQNSRAWDVTMAPHYLFLKGPPYHATTDAERKG